MATTTFSNGVTLTDADWFNDVDAVVYEWLGDGTNEPSTRKAARDNLFTAGTVTTDSPIISATQTWNAGAVTFNGFKLNVTDTASAAASLLMNLQVGGSSKFTLTKAGNGAFAGTLTVDGASGFGVAPGSYLLSVRQAHQTDGSMNGQILVQSTAAYNAGPIAGINFSNKYHSDGSYAGMGGISVAKENATSGNLASFLALHTRGSTGDITERLRIDSSGNFFWQDATTLAGITIGTADVKGIDISDGARLLSSRGNTAAREHIVFYNPNGDVGSIDTSASATAYNTSSDRDLKKDLGVATSIDVLQNTIVHDFAWLVDGKMDRGVFAQEAHLVKPSAITVGNDELDEHGRKKRVWSADYSKYVPDLLVGWQNHESRLRALEQENQELKKELAVIKSKLGL